MQDYDTTYPSQTGDGIFVFAAKGKDQGHNYYDELVPYIKNGSVWICRSDSPNPYDKSRLVPPPMGYHMNGNLITATGLSEAAVAAPSNCMMMRESGAGIVWQQAYLRPFAKGCDAIVGWKGPSGQNGPHMNGYNFLLADTHAKWFSDTQSLNLSQFPEDPRRSTTALHPKPNPPCPAS